MLPNIEIVRRNLEVVQVNLKIARILNKGEMCVCVCARIASLHPGFVD